MATREHAQLLTFGILVQADGASIILAAFCVDCRQKLLELPFRQPVALNLAPISDALDYLEHQEGDHQEQANNDDYRKG